MDINDKYNKLQNYLKSLGNAAIAFSGGVDSAFLLKAAKNALGDNVIAVTVRSCLIPESEILEAAEFCRREKIRHFICGVNPLEISGFENNPPERCYICKKAIFKVIKEAAYERGISVVAEGSNIDDNEDYRPGLKAIKELGVLSPLQETGFTKKEIRGMSEKLKLPTWNKPSLACLASRFAYGEKITKERLARVERAEKVLADLGLKQFRVRVHGDIARIEALPEDFQKLVESSGQIYSDLKSLGFSYAAMDLQGYRTGSMNETIIEKKA